MTSAPRRKFAFGKGLSASDALIEAYYRLRRQCSVLRDGGGRFEGEPWQRAQDMVMRDKDGWQLRVYKIDGAVEACLIDPHGVTRTYA